MSTIRRSAPVWSAERPRTARLPRRLTGTQLAPGWGMATPVEAIEATLAVWPNLEIDPPDIFRHVELLGVGSEELAQYGTHLCLAVACARGGSHAVRILERDFMGAARVALCKLRASSDLAEEALQVLRERLLVGSKPRIGTYTGRGPLPGWLSRAAINVGFNLMQSERALSRRTLPEHAWSDEPKDHAPAYQAVAQKAFDASVAELTARERELLREQARGQSIDVLAKRLGLHRATIARKLVALRERLSHDVRQRFRTHFGMTTSEARIVLARVALEIDTTHSLDLPESIPGVSCSNWPADAPSDSACRRAS